eukprot:TRINITY_DN5558_c0_g1_i1.p1 TRINITY_DN5558_c0_g1~~TRINITY_DN5558_c0_g1_i1.p1  ORF type:complete len:289 (+),score=47.58 TRINITY_DN5558_c0_g1_i1:195-1061(+)
MEPEKVSRKVATVLQTKMGKHGNGFEAAQIGRENFTAKMDPFLNIDHFNHDRQFFGPHPHAGFCPITFVCDDSEGSISNRDTINEQIVTLIGPGDLFFNTAGSGMMHEENPSENGKNVHGLQIFINLSAKNKGTKPKHNHLKRAKIPLVEEESGARVWVVLGQHGETRSPLRPLTPVTMLDIKIPKGVEFTHDVPKGWNAFLLVLKGKLVVGPEKTSAPKLSAIGFAEEGDTVDFTSLEESHVVLFAGEPLNEPIVMDGPFCANTREQLKKMQNDYLQGKMGKLKKSF